MGFPWWLSGKEFTCQCRDVCSSPGSGRFPGEGNGNPLQYSCLENPMDGGAWWATVHGVAKSRTRLSDFTSLELVNLAFKECLGLCRRCEVSLSRSKGPRTRPGPAVKAFDSGKAQPSSPGGGWPGPDLEPDVPPEAHLCVKPPRTLAQKAASPGLSDCGLPRWVALRPHP